MVAGISDGRRHIIAIMLFCVAMEGPHRYPFSRTRTRAQLQPRTTNAHFQQKSAPEIQFRARLVFLKREILQKFS